MHRGSSKAARGAPPAADTLPLSAPFLTIEVDVARAGRTTAQRLEVAPGTLVREVVRRAGLAPEGTSVLMDGSPVPLDQPIGHAGKIVVIPTFSGG
jgi:sulfur carrier protein ThiS